MSQNLHDLGEKGLLKILQKYHGKDTKIIRTFSEDCAVIDDGERNYQLFSVDALVEGVHFKREYVPSFYLGRKALKVNVSDISAMGGRPNYFLVSIGAPPATPVKLVEEVYDGLSSVSKELEMALIGGNVTTSPFLFVDLIVIGSVSKKSALMRNGSRKGDLIFVSGRLGGAAEGLRLLQEGFRLLGDGLIIPAGQRDSSFVREAILHHLDPPCLNGVARRLASSGMVRSMIDLSDGLASDLTEICQESHVGAEVNLQKLPVAPEVLHWERKRGQDPALLALHGGEDYHLLFTVAKVNRQKILDLARKVNMECFEIGNIVNESEGIYLLDEEGERREIGHGYEHFS